MAYCGAPTGEAGGLQRQDVMVSGEVPYIWFRDHKDRIMGKKRLERIVPLIDPLLGFLSDYLSKVELNKTIQSSRLMEWEGIPPLSAQRN